MCLGEAKDLLRACSDALREPRIGGVFEALAALGLEELEEGRRLLLDREWASVLARFDFDVSEAGLDAMKAGVLSFGHDADVRRRTHEVEQLCLLAPGDLFGVPLGADELEPQPGEGEVEPAEDECDDALRIVLGLRVKITGEGDFHGYYGLVVDFDEDNDPELRMDDGSLRRFYRWDCTALRRQGGD